jgi:meiotic recombination protein REC8
VPEFALTPPHLLAHLGLDVDSTIARSGESQSFTPFDSQTSSQASALGGLVLPDDSSPQHFQGFELQGDHGQVAFNGTLPGADDGLDPGFTFDNNGNYIEPPSPKALAGTPARGVGMLSDAGTSARVRTEHEEGRLGGAQVSFTIAFHAVCHPPLTT